MVGRSGRERSILLLDRHGIVTLMKEILINKMVVMIETETTDIGESRQPHRMDMTDMAETDMLIASMTGILRRRRKNVSENPSMTEHVAVAPNGVKIAL